jgi:predicted Zn-dependent protease
MKKLLPILFLSMIVFSCKKESTPAPGTLSNSYSNQALGAAAKDMLSGGTYTNISIQVQYMPGYALEDATISNITAYLNGICNKPGGVTVSQTQIGANGDTLDVNKVAVIESQNRTTYNTGNTLALYILVTDGYDTAAATLGFAYRATSICLFGGNIFAHSGGFGEVSREALESGVLEHELGHIMGLVNLTTPMVTQHQDAAHGYHCNNSKCLMYYAMETNDVFGMIGANNIPVLDSNCLKDLQANGGK